MLTQELAIFVFGHACSDFALSAGCEVVFERYLLQSDQNAVWDYARHVLTTRLATLKEVNKAMSQSANSHIDKRSSSTVLTVILMLKCTFA